MIDSALHMTWAEAAFGLSCFLIGYFAGYLLR